MRNGLGPHNTLVSTRETKIVDEHGNPMRVATEVRSAQFLRAGFDVAKTTVENQEHWTQADSYAPNSSIPASVRSTLRFRSRYEVKNNSYLKGMLTTKTNYIIGAGPRLQMLTPSKDSNREIEKSWVDWARKTRFNDKLRVLIFAYQQDGESFGIFANPTQLDHPVQMTLRTLEADQIADPMWRLLEWYNDERRIDGITLDKNGEARSYHMLKYHPGSNRLDMIDRQGKWINKDLVLHLYREDRPGQRRGVPHVTPCLPLFAILRRYTLASLGSAENAANVGLFLKTDQGATHDAPDDVEAFLQIPFVRNMMMSLPYGWDMSQLRSEQPSDRFVEFHKQVLNEAARCLELPYNVAAANSAEYNYASGRLDHQMFNRSIEIEQRRVEDIILERTLSQWLREYLAAATGIAPSDIDLANYPHRWGWDPLPHVDPQKVAAADIMYWEKGLLSDHEYFLQQNIDPDEHYAELAEQQRIREELKLPLPGIAMQAIDTDGDSQEDQTPGTEEEADQES